MMNLQAHGGSSTFSVKLSAVAPGPFVSTVILGGLDSPIVPSVVQMRKSLQSEYLWSETNKKQLISFSTCMLQPEERKWLSDSTEPGTPVKRDAYPNLYYLVSVHAKENKASIIRCKQNGKELDLSSLLKVDTKTLQIAQDPTTTFEETIELFGNKYLATRSQEEFDFVDVCWIAKNKSRQWSYTQYRSMKFHMNLAAEMKKFSASLDRCKDIKLKDRLKSLFGPNSGTSILFNLSSANSTILEATCYFRRIPYLALMDKPNGTYFLSSRSYTSIPPQGRGLKVAFTATKVITKADQADKINSLEWRFGIVAGMDNKQVFLYEAVPCGRGVKHFESLLRYQLDEVTLVGLNEICHESVRNGFVVTSGLGPDKMSSKSVNEKAMMNQKIWDDAKQIIADAKNDGSEMKPLAQTKIIENVPNFIANEIGEGEMIANRESFATREIEPSCFMSYNRSNHKRSSLAKKGATIVIIAGPKELLKYLEKDSGLWCPLVGDIKSQSCWKQTYAKLSKSDVKSTNFTSLKSSKSDFDSMFEGHDTIELQCYDVAKYPNGLMFAYKVDESKTNMEVVDEIICEEPLEHWEVFSREYGVVLSHSIQDNRIYTVTTEDYDCIRKFTRGCTYGDGRDVCESTGGNFYSGCKLSSRAIPKPDSCPDMNPYFQLDRQEWDSTYGPSFFKLLNRLTRQASDTMAMLNPLLDFFITKVKEKAGLGQNHSDFRRHCVMSILTFGENTDGFQNSSHIDLDYLAKEFTSHAINIMEECEKTDDAMLSQELQFINVLIDLCGNHIPAPSNCGYSPVQIGEMESESNFHSHFLIPGLGVALRCCSKFYHFFYAAIMTHCTAIPITIQRNGSVGIAVEAFNMVAWGASRCSKMVEDRSFLYAPNATKKRKERSANPPKGNKFDAIESVILGERGILKAFENTYY